MDTKSKARQLRSNPTEAEKALWRQFRLRQIASFRFRRQHPLGQYIVDFFCFEKGLVIEIDGGQHSESVEYGARRTRWLESEGYRVLRFWNNQVLGEIEAVKQVILEELTKG